MKLEGFNSFSQLDVNLTERQSLTATFALYPQKLNYLGLNTFTPQPSTPDLHQRGYMASIQHRYTTGPDSLLVSQFSYKRFDADVTANSNDSLSAFRSRLRREAISTGRIGTRIAPSGRKRINSSAPTFSARINSRSGSTSRTATTTAASNFCRSLSSVFQTFRSRVSTSDQLRDLTFTRTKPLGSSRINGVRCSASPSISVCASITTP